MKHIRELRVYEVFRKGENGRFVRAKLQVGIMQRIIKEARDSS